MCDEVMFLSLLAPCGLVPGTQSEVYRAKDERPHQPNGEDEEWEGGGGNGREARMRGQSDAESILSQSKTQDSVTLLLPNKQKRFLHDVFKSFAQFFVAFKGAKQLQQLVVGCRRW